MLAEPGTKSIEVHGKTPSRPANDPRLCLAFIWAYANRPASLTA
jgi:hypothetical protein